MTTTPLRLPRFLLVGGLCYLLNLSLLYAATAILGLHYLVSAFLAFALVNSLGYLINRRYTFRQESGLFWRGLLRYNLVTLSSCCWVLLLMYLLVSCLGMGYLTANIMISIGIAGYNFLLHTSWTFR